MTGYTDSQIKPAPTPFVDETKDPLCVLPDEFDEKDDMGELSSIACKVLMQIMYLARFGRPDLLRAVSALATRVTSWTTLCDKKLLRIIQYMKFSKDWKQIGFVGDSITELELGLYTDADFASDRGTMKSTAAR